MKRKGLTQEDQQILARAASRGQHQILTAMRNEELHEVRYMAHCTETIASPASQAMTHVRLLEEIDNY